jgi:hypothetical protein
MARLGGVAWEREASRVGDGGRLIGGSHPTDLNEFKFYISFKLGLLQN